VPSFETREIISGTATLLALVGGASLAWHWKKAALVLSVVPLFSQSGQGSLPPGFQIVAHAQSLYGLVETIDDRSRHARFLRADHSIIGAEYVADHSSAFTFTHILESVHFIRPAAVDVLQVGLGAGSLPTALFRRGLRVDVVEIDPTVANFARLYFGFETRGDVYEEDARTFLRRTTRRYDIVVHDTFTGGTTPEHLLSLEVVRRIHEMLRPGGLLALNFAGYHQGPKAEASRAVMRTLRASFPEVRAFADSAPGEDPTGVSNILFFASDDHLDFSVPEGARFENATCEASLRSFQGWEVLTEVPDGPSITDERNPLARLQIPIAEDHFRAMKELLPAEVWLH
jgi:spermidine synthase